MSIATPTLASEPIPAAATAEPAFRPRPWLAAWTLCRREWVRFIRQGNRVFAALGQPIIFWILFSSLLGPSFHLTGPDAAAPLATAPDGATPATPSDTAAPTAGGMEGSYAQYFFAGTLVMIILFTAIFTTISVIEDRREGFLQAVLVAPVPRWSVVAGKVLGGSLIALAHAAVFLLLCFALDLPLTVFTVPLVLVVLFLTGVALTSLGLAIAWPMQSTQGFHAIMMVFLLPMWLLSGAFAPPGHNWIGLIIRCNPLTYCIALLQWILYSGATPAVRAKVLTPLPAPWICTLVTLGFVGAMFTLASWIAGVRRSGDAT